MRERIPALVAVLVVIAVAAPAAAAKAPPRTTVTCGQVVTKSIRVANDLSGCGRVGLEVGAPHITIDLDGHTIAGTGPDALGSGVASREFDGVIVRNGTVRNFFAGVSIDQAAGNVIDRMASRGNTHGYLVSESSHAAITDSFAADGFSGAVLGFLTTNSRVSRFRAVDVVDGVAVSILAVGNLVERSEAIGTEIGFHVHESDRNTVIRNRATGNRFGVLVDGSSDENRILGNDVRGATDTGIRAAEASRNVIEENFVTRSAGDGIFVGHPGSGNVLARNRAFENGLLGINAESAAVDGGGNRAHGNGDPRQCVGVVCRR